MQQPSKHDWGSLFWFGIMALIAVLIGSFAIGRAHAQEGGDPRDGRWHTQRFCAHYGWDGSCTRYRYERRRYYAQRQYRDPVRYYAAPRHDEERDNGRRSCRDVRRAVGDQHLTVDGAKKQADEAWAAAVRFHHGEKFLDLANARHLAYTCSRSSIKEGGVTTLGQTLTRCELEAVPCSPARQRDEERDRE
jgi:hypothetical protein